MLRPVRLSPRAGPAGRGVLSVTGRGLDLGSRTKTSRHSHARAHAPFLPGTKQPGTPCRLRITAEVRTGWRYPATKDATVHAAQYAAVSAATPTPREQDDHGEGLEHAHATRLHGRSDDVDAPRCPLCHAAADGRYRHPWGASLHVAGSTLSGALGTRWPVVVREPRTPTAGVWPRRVGWGPGRVDDAGWRGVMTPAGRPR